MTKMIEMTEKKKIESSIETINLKNIHIASQLVIETIKKNMIIAKKINLMIFPEIKIEKQDGVLDLHQIMISNLIKINQTANGDNSQFNNNINPINKTLGAKAIIIIIILQLIKPNLNFLDPNKELTVDSNIQTIKIHKNFLIIIHLF